MRAVRGAPPGAITLEQQRTLRDAADALVFARAHDEAVRRALAEVRRVVSAVYRAEHSAWIEQLAADLEDCGPSAGPVAVSPAVGLLPSVVVPPSRRRADR